MPAGIKKHDENAHIFAMINNAGLIGGFAKILIPRINILITNEKSIITNATNEIMNMQLSMSDSSLLT